MLMKIIVSWYNENIEWTEQFSDVIIYNKGEPLNDSKYNEIILKNVGREGHTFYHHIVDNYDNLDDYQIFLQGNPFDHYSNILFFLNQIKIEQIFPHDFFFLSDEMLICNLNGCKYHANLPIKYIYKELFENPKTFDMFEFAFGCGGQFIVSKRCILKKPKSFYEKIVKMLEYDNCPIEGYIIERLNGVIFSWWKFLSLLVKSEIYENSLFLNMFK